MVAVTNNVAVAKVPPLASSFDTAVAAEADLLCRMIDRHAEDLRRACLGRTFHLDRIPFRLWGVGRNAIYRINHGNGWFLRLSRASDPTFMARERCGADAITGALASRSDYCGPTVVRVSLNRSYVLTPAVDGRPLNHLLATRSWWPGTTGAVRVVRSFQTLGAQLAALHETARAESATPQAHERPFTALRRRLGRVSPQDGMRREIEVWLDAHDRTDEGGTFVHGNLRLDNILQRGARLGLIDFEHSGSGSRYQDLSRPVSQLLLTRATGLFPRSVIRASLDGFLEHYQLARPLEMAELDAYVACRFAHYCVVHAAGGLVAGRTAGLPVWRKQLQQLTRTLFERGLLGTVPDAGTESRLH